MILFQAQDVTDHSVVADKAEIQMNLVFQWNVFMIVAVSVKRVQDNFLYIRVWFFQKNGHADVVISKRIANDENNYCTKEKQCV